jgi:peptide/nickel transport system permease protein/peptide/nickel transport system substrate-binding protein
MTGRSGPDHVYLYALFDTLVEWDYVSLTPLPGLAESWTYPDANTLVLKLRPGIKFHDGEVFDAEAVKANLEWGRSNEKSSVKVDLASIDTIEVRGPHEVALKLKRSDRALPLILSDRAGMMRSPKAVREKGADHDRSPVGTGAYKFVSWADKDQVVLTRNPDYWKRDMAKLKASSSRSSRNPRPRCARGGRRQHADLLRPAATAGGGQRSGKLVVNIGRPCRSGCSISTMAGAVEGCACSPRHQPCDRPCDLHQSHVWRIG